jgi:iron complex outermembrane receptor protein
MADTFHILGGGRYDWARTGSGLSDQSLAAAKRTWAQDTAFSPRVGVLYQPQDWISMYGSYTESFGANNGRSATGKPFSPETATQYEIGLKANLLDERLQATLAFYTLTKHNVLTPDLSTPDPTDSIAIGAVRSRGIEYDVAGQVTQRLSLIGSYALTDTRITRDNSGNKGNRFASVPLHAGSLWAKYEVNSGYLTGLSIGGGIFLRSQRQGDNENTFQLPGYTRLDAMVAYQFFPFGSPVTVQLNLYNLTDHTYYDRSSNRLNIHAGEPLNFMGSIRWEF